MPAVTVTASASTSGAPRSVSSSSAAASSSSSSSSPYARPTPARRSRISSLAADPALETLGAIYVGWQAGERDPAPLCCPRLVKQSLIRKYGPAAVGYLAVAPQGTGRGRLAAPPPQPPYLSAPARRSHLDRAQLQSIQRSDVGRTSTTSSPLPSLPTTVSLGPLPPLPPLPSSSSASSQSVSPPDLGMFCSPLGSDSSRVPLVPPLPALSSFSPAHLPSTPPEISVPGSLLTVTTATTVSDFDPCEFLNTSLALFQSGGGSASQPTSPSLVFPPLPPIAPAAPSQFACVAEQFTDEIRRADDKLETVPEDEYDESLWSAGEDPLGSSAATDVMSEASWAW
ncbi:hypothetical protein JCM3774_003873 [Rhodotorula dairenensis]